MRRGWPSAHRLHSTRRPAPSLFHDKPHQDKSRNVSGARRTAGPAPTLKEDELLQESFFPPGAGCIRQSDSLKDLAHP